MTESLIHDVSDTAVWVATYRARETERRDALFRDPLARILAGVKVEDIAKNMGAQSRYTAWSVVIRTVIIDAFITEVIEQGADTVLNCGAGLDTRPYRLDVPASLRWIEVDYPKIIQLKEERLKGETPRCRLERVALDLSAAAARQRLFADVAGRSLTSCSSLFDAAASR